MLGKISRCFMTTFPRLPYLLLLALLPCLLSQPVWADAELWGGKPSLGLEFEHQKMAFGAGHSNSLTLVPGLSFKDSFIHKVDVLIEAERENEIEDGVNEKTHVKKLALRLKKNFELDDSWALFVRGLVGREWNTLENFNYSYVDTGIHYEYGAFGFMAGWRFQRTLDGTAGHDRNKFRFGPSYEIDAHHEIELRFVRAWNVQTRKRDSDALIAEYTYKF
jgi:hypothetical protein